MKVELYVNDMPNMSVPFGEPTLPSEKPMRDATHLGTCPSVSLHGPVLVYLLRLAATGFAGENILEVMSGDKQGNAIALRVLIDRLKVGGEARGNSTQIDHIQIQYGYRAGGLTLTSDALFKHVLFAEPPPCEIRRGSVPGPYFTSDFRDSGSDGFITMRSACSMAKDLGEPGSHPRSGKVCRR